MVGWTFISTAELIDQYFLIERWLVWTDCALATSMQLEVQEDGFSCDRNLANPAARQGDLSICEAACENQSPQSLFTLFTKISKLLD